MALYDQIVVIYPELALMPAVFFEGVILLQDDGQGPYIKAWNYPKLHPIPAQLAAA